MNFKLLAAAGSACVLMTGCIDSDYDLSDVDTTSEVKIDNLTLPINIEAMKLDDVFDIEDSENFKIVEINGERYYALSETGEFHSDPIHIAAIHLDAPHINPTYCALELPYNSAKTRSTMVNVPIPSTATEFHCTTGGIDNSVLGMDALTTANTTLTITATLDGMSMSHAKFSNLEFILPKRMKVSNLSAGKYDPTTGILTVPYIEPKGGNFKITLSIDKIDLTATDLKYNRDAHTLAFTGNLGLDSGSLSFDLADLGTQAPKWLALNVGYKLSDIDVTALTGDIDYHIEGVNIAPVHITGIPDFLKGEGTDIKIANPQLYIALNNPVGGDRLRCETGFRLTTRRENSPIPAMTFNPDNNGRIKIGYDKGVAGPYNFVLAPDRDKIVPVAGYGENLQFLGFSSLSNLLSVPDQYKDKAVLPDYIDIDLVDPGIPSQPAVDFPVGRNLQAVSGHYELLAPLGLKEGSIVVYEDTDDGWYDDDLEGLVIEQMVITAKADNDAPVSAQLASYPIEVGGKVNENDKVESTVLAANTKDQDLTITLTGEVRKLDGLLIRAIIRSSENEAPLGPDQLITFKNVRVKVSGTYSKDI